MQLKHILFITGLAGIVGFTWPTLSDHKNDAPFGSRTWVNKEVNILKAKASGDLNAHVLTLSLKAYVKARKQGIDKKQLLTIIDYSKPSTEKRLWVFDLKRNREVLNTWVSHGKGSGGLKPTSFSNKSGSHKSSIGVFVTDKTYFGGKGYSLRLRGLEPGINDNAYSRDIVVHGAWYASGQTVRKYGQAGRSWGCPAVGPKYAKPLIDTIKGNTLLFAYYPDQHWLNTSHYLA